MNKETFVQCVMDVFSAGLQLSAASMKSRGKNVLAQSRSLKPSNILGINSTNHLCKPAYIYCGPSGITLFLSLLFYQ